MLKAGFYEKNITPPLGCDIPGFFLPRVANDVLEDLYARAVVFDDGKETVAMLAVDALGVHAALTEKILDRASEYAGIRKENILVCATHLHTGGPVEPDTLIKEDAPYLDMLSRLAADAITLAQRRMEPVTAKFIMGHVDSISFVRNFKMKGGYVMTNPEPNNPDIIEPCADIDPELPVLLLCDAADRPKGAVISFACHQDCLCGEKCAYSTDFAGVMDKELKKEYGSDFISVFFEGACGNINHWDVFAQKGITMEHHRKMGRILATEIKSIVPEAAVLSRQDIAVKKETLSLRKRLFTQQQLDEAKEFLKACEGKEIVYTEFNPESEFMKYHYAHRALRYVEDPSESYEAQLQVIRIGDCLLYAMPGEVFVQFGRKIKQLSPSEHNVIAELAFDSPGYIPTRELFQPTVYESTLPTCQLEPDAGDEIVNKLSEMGRAIF